GVIHGVGELHALNLQIWLNFSLSIILVFALWWLFFTLISDRTCKPGFINSSLLELLYIPTLIALGLIGMSFGGLFERFEEMEAGVFSFKAIFGLSLCLFLLGINMMLYLLEYPPPYHRLKQRSQLVLYVALVLVVVATFARIDLSLFTYLLIILGLILAVIFLLNYSWYSMHTNTQMDPKT
ncbi:MAG: hypothetical protein KDC44_16550, partial [Phaeodactylibacter sp.]|nr:hypothetical protein [Phaeodactylibacter sp.]